MTTITSRALHQETSRAKKATRVGPVFITEHGQPTHVLLSIESYQNLVRGGSIVDMLAMSEDIDFEPPSVSNLYRPVELS